MSGKSKKAGERGDGRREAKLLLSGAVLFGALTGLLMFLFRRYPDFFFPGYRKFSKGAMKVLSAVTSVVPFSVWDLVIAGIAAASLTGLVLTVVKRKSFLRWLARVLFTVVFLFFLETLLWNLNHYGPRLKEEIGLEVSRYTDADLAEVLCYFYDSAADLAEAVPRSGSGAILLPERSELMRTAGRAYEPLGETAEIFRNGSLSPVKYQTLGSLVLPWFGIAGEFVGFTGEASVPLGDTTANVPFSMCHEAGHRLGIASEEDANFAAFLACEASEDACFRYSGFYTAFIYCYNALYESDESALREVMSLRSGSGYDKVLSDCSFASEYYAQYDGPMEEVGEKVNDTALRAFSEDDGTRSYSLVVNELIAWYRVNIGAD